jgi:sulfotransferase family protein
MRTESALEASPKPISKFVRKPPPVIVRAIFSLFLLCIVGPIARLLDALGRQEWLFQRLRKNMIRSQNSANPFRKYVPTKHDVFVATFAKSGTNWMMQIAHQLAFHGEGEFDHIHSVVPWPDTDLMPPLHGYAIPVEDPSVWKASPEQKRVIKTHFDWESLPYSEEARYIIVIRDPKDVFVSSYFFFVKNGPLEPIIRSVDGLLRIFLSEDFPVGGSWAVNTAGYWAQRHRRNVMIVSFKSMKQDLRGTVRKVADFIEVRVSDDVINRVCERSSFDYMKRLDDKFRTWKMVPWRSPSPMIRAGKQGGSSELLRPEQQRQIDAYFMAELKRLGSDFPYAEFCDIAP